MKNFILGLALLSVLAHASALQGESQFVIVPDGVADAQALIAAHQALVGRQWTVRERSPLEIKATLAHKLFDCTLYFRLESNRLLKREQCKQTLFSGPNNNPRVVDSEVPERWLAYLRSDIDVLLLAAPRAQRPEPGRRDSAGPAERLRALEALKRDDLITEQEYQKKRAEILSDF